VFPEAARTYFRATRLGLISHQEVMCSSQASNVSVIRTCRHPETALTVALDPMLQVRLWLELCKMSCSPGEALSEIDIIDDSPLRAK